MRLRIGGGIKNIMIKIQTDFCIVLSFNSTDERALDDGDTFLVLVSGLLAVLVDVRFDVCDVLCY